MFKIFIPAFLVLVLINNVKAESHALLVGIGDYHVKPLAGPINDVDVMQSVLTEKWGFKKNNINILLNKEGTKQNILDAINRLYNDSKAGDDVFIYLSGHGTSAGDKSFSSPLPTTSGAFLPIDITNIKSKQELVSRLVIGRNDLKPLLKRFDENGRHVFVAIDACYSGNTVRGNYSENKLNTRFIDLRDILPSRAFGDDLKMSDTSTDWGNSTDTNEYPYKNIYYLSASGEHEPAQDIPSNMIDKYPTIDGRPHGAFSDTLLRVLDDSATADINNDGVTTYSELKKTVRDNMRLRGFDHTPQGLPSLAEDKGMLSTRALFNHKEKQVASSSGMPVVAAKPVVSDATLNIDQTELKVTIDQLMINVRNSVSDIKGIQSVTKNSHLEIRKKGDDVLFISQAGDLILRLVKPSTEEVVAEIEIQVWIRQLIEKPFLQYFNIDLELYAGGSGSTAVEGETVGLSVMTAKDAHILIINIDPHGTINVLYPYTVSEMQKIDAHQLLAFEELTKVVPPFGREYIQAYAFISTNKFYESLRGKSFDIQSPLAKKLMHLLDDNQLVKARANLEVVTSTIP